MEQFESDFVYQHQVYGYAQGIQNFILFYSTHGSANRQGVSIQQTTDIVMKENVCFKPLVQTWLVEKKKKKKQFPTFW